ncbi:MAG: DUF1385 domain-containing protein [Candidatus Woesearchaeota archaeon]
MKLVGGQAVIEGVMMRCGSKVATAIRKNGKIKIKKEKVKLFSDNHKFLKWPLVRGFVNLIELLVLGIKTLEWSGQEAAGEDEKLGKGMVAVTITAAVVLALFLFVFLPYVITYGLGLKEQAKPIAFNLVDGVVKLSVLIMYIWLIGFMKDIKVLFQYHGAEHKAVAAYEHGKSLTVKNAQKYGTAHARCGTSFMLFVIIVGIAVFSFVPVLLFKLYPGLATARFLVKYPILFVARLLVLPIIAGISYELLRQSPKFEKKRVFAAVLWPGLAVQKLTTKEPTEKQIEVAIAALKSVV